MSEPVHTADLDRLRAELRWERSTVRGLLMVAGNRERMREQHRREVGDREATIADLHAAVVELLAAFNSQPNLVAGSRKWAARLDDAVIRRLRKTVVEAEKESA